MALGGRRLSTGLRARMGKSVLADGTTVDLKSQSAPDCLGAPDEYSTLAALRSRDRGSNLLGEDSQTPVRAGPRPLAAP